MPRIFVKDVKGPAKTLEVRFVALHPGPVNARLARLLNLGTAWTAGDSDGLGEAKTDGAHSLAGLDFARDVAVMRT